MLSLSLAVSLFGCTDKEKDDRVAATVNGTEIMEADVTARIKSFMVDPSTGEALEGAAWATLLAQNDFTPASLRDYVIRYDFAIYTLLLQKAEAAGIIPDTDAVETTITSTKSGIESSGGTFEDYLKSIGISSEDAYRQILLANSVKDAVAAKMIDQELPPQADIDTYISENAAMYPGKRVSIIYFYTDAEDPEKSADAVKTKAEAAHQEIVGGATFESVAEKYLTDDPELGKKGGDLGWGTENYLPQEVQDALKTLELDETSDVIEVATEIPSEATEEEKKAEDYVEQVEYQYTYFIAKFTGDFPLTEEEQGQPVDVARVPEELVDQLTDEYVAQINKERQDKYFTDLAKSAEILINPMPEGLPYDVDMTLAGTEDDIANPDDTLQDWVNPFEGEVVPDPVYDENGLGISDSLLGTGPEVKDGDVVLVNYIGNLEDGTTFDDSFSRGEPFSVTVGAGEVIEGWELGLIGMKVGGHRVLFIPPELGYGEMDLGSIPPNSTLIFYVELVSVNGDSTGYTPATGTQ